MSRARTARSRAGSGEPIERIPVLRPQLPAAERLLPYLRRIDASRVYSNWGPLTAELEVRLGERLRLPPGGLSSAASGTAALIGAILARAGRADDERPLALIPGFTFTATASAVEQCGYRPYLADVDPVTWMLDPALVADHPVLERVGVVVVVAPFGRPAPQEPWIAFTRATGVPVVFDAAASFDLIEADPEPFLGEIPVAMSFHATKGFATGEGGCVASNDRELVVRASQALNFGFYMTRDTRAPSINGKMSEYHAAVGMAELDGWSEKHDALRSVAAQYHQRLTDAGLSDRLHVTADIGASYVVYRCASPVEATHIEACLTGAGVDFRRWYGNGLHRHTYFSTLEHDPLPTTEELAAALLGLPVAPDLAEPAVARVVAALAKAAQ